MSVLTPQTPPVRTACHHCHGTGYRQRPPKPTGECQAPWWDMTSEPFAQWTCGRPVDRGQKHCPEHKRQLATLTTLAQAAQHKDEREPDLYRDRIPHPYRDGDDICCQMTRDHPIHKAPGKDER